MNIEIAISLGSNLGDRLKHLSLAKSSLQSHPLISNLSHSSVYKTAPVNCPEDAPDFYNAVVTFHYKGTPEALLDFCQKTESEMGRDLELKQKIVNAPRVIDLDILYYGQQQVSSERLTIPHQYLLERRFVLEPLTEISPHFKLPESRFTILEHLNNLSSNEPELIRVSSGW